MTLIERFGLEKDVSANAGAGADAKAAWLDTAQKREASLKERKAAMILAARQCVFSFFALCCLHCCCPKRLLWFPQLCFAVFAILMVLTYIAMLYRKLLEKQAKGKGKETPVAST